VLASVERGGGFVCEQFPRKNNLMRLIDIPAHLLYLITEHRILVFVGAIVVPAVIGTKRRASVKRVLARGYLAIILFVLLAANIFWGPQLSAYVLYHNGATGPAQITGSHTLDWLSYSRRNVIRYDVQLKTADGTIVDTSFDDIDANRFPPIGAIPEKRDDFNVRYLSSFPGDFMIVTDDNSPWARRVACRALDQKLYESERKYEFDQHGPTYRNAYIAALDAMITAKCGDNQADLDSYRRRIENAKADKN